MHAFSLQAAEKLLFWSNALYLLGALLTLGAAGWLAYQRRARLSLSAPPSHTLNDGLLLAPAMLCLVTAMGAIWSSGAIMSRVRVMLEGYRMQAAQELAHIREDAEADGVAAHQQPSLGALPGSPTFTDAALSETQTGSQGPASLASPRELNLAPGAGEPLRTFGGMRAVVEAVPGDTEAAQFADHLLLLLIANGIDARQGSDGSVLHHLVGESGIHIRYMDPDGAHDLAAALAKLLRGQGLHVDVAPSWDLAAHLEKRGDPMPRHDHIIVSVGPKS